MLLGRDPAALVDELSPPARIPASPPDVPLGLPSDLLRRRPDIRRAEAQLHAATAQIGVATADLYPKFSLTGDMGYQRNRLEQLTHWASRFWSFSPAVSWPVFEAGSIRSNIAVQDALTAQALATWEKTVLTAMQDVENALVAYAQEQEHRKLLQEAVTANRKAVETATTLYTQGLTEFLNVLVAQQALFNSESALVQSTQNLSTDLVALYKALGGGWEYATFPTSTQPAGPTWVDFTPSWIPLK